MNRSPNKHEFSTKSYIEKLKKDPQDENALLMIEYYNEAEEKDKILSEDSEWRKDNLEYDLRTTEWIIEKAKCDKVYAQHLYAALCNNEFTRNEVWPILTEKKWSCSWRRAGGIIADMREEGDYIDWYCSGIVDNIEIDTELNNADNPLSQHERERMLELKAHVAESVVTDEIREDLLKLGWFVIADNSWNK
jgi:hypothetical protein